MANWLLKKLFPTLLILALFVAPVYGAITFLSPSQAFALSAIQEDEDKAGDDEEDEDKPLVSDEQADDALTGIIKFFSRRRNKQDNDDTDQPRLIGGTVQIRVTDWAGRPTDGAIELENEENTYRATTVAGRAQIDGVRPGLYSATLDPVRGLAPPPSSIIVQKNRTSVLTLRTLDPDADHSPFDKVDPPTAPLPGKPAIPGDRDLGPPPDRPDLPGRNYGQGDRMVIKGWGRDPQGRPVDVVAIISHNGRDIGHIRTVASRYVVFDLERGEEYGIRARSAYRRDGPWVEKRLTIGNTVATLIFVVER